MDLSGAILKIIPNAEYTIIGNDYNRLKWSETNTQPKPTLAECEAAWQEIMAEAPMKILREERNKKLFDTDYRIVVDFPHPSEEVKQAWITYRQELRDLPANSTPGFHENGQLTGVTWPTPPS
tara:strand:- start:41 stop:409 length:369 start_codon:yes stop_codon:yes gene_type:complete